jgi:cellulose biosynthesis protein BcsQ
MSLRQNCVNAKKLKLFQLCMMTILTLANSKGGDGKTIIAACLAAELTRRGKHVVLLDAGRQRSLTVWRGNDRKLKDLEPRTDATEIAAGGIQPPWFLMIAP